MKKRSKRRVRPTHLLIWYEQVAQCLITAIQSPRRMGMKRDQASVGCIPRVPPETVLHSKTLKRFEIGLVNLKRDFIQPA